jgi:hypothetical protein
MQADAIPDWAIYILFTPFVPIAGFVHFSLGVLQTTAILGASARRLILSRRHQVCRPQWIRTAYLPFFLLPNIAVVVWSILSDPTY